MAVPVKYYVWLYLCHLHGLCRGPNLCKVERLDASCTCAPIRRPPLVRLWHLSLLLSESSAQCAVGAPAMTASDKKQPAGVVSCDRCRCGH